MTGDSYMNFIPGVNPPEDRNAKDFWFVFNSGNILVNLNEDKVEIPYYEDVEGLVERGSKIYYLGKFDGVDSYACELDEKFETRENMEFRTLRSIVGLFDERFFNLAGKAYQMLEWSKNHKYCGRCGSLMEDKKDERAKLCPSCGLVNYPRISPAIIVAIVRDGKLLLAHNKQFAGNMYSVIAGFLDQGETFEDCVRREVWEEVGIRVKNIKYFQSQPWPFPNSLMVAFTAEYAEGEIKVDGVEIDDANWYAVGEIPRRPTTGSVAGKLIQWFIDNYSVQK